MENLSKVLDKKTLEDLQIVEEKNTGSNLIEPTEVEIEAILTHLKEGKDLLWIRRNVRRVEEGSAKGFSFGQIEEIRQAWEVKLVELSPKEEEIKE